MLRAARELLAVRSPLDAELMVSELLGTWWGQRARARARGASRRRRADIEELVGEGLVAYAAEQGSPAALALLSGIACLGTPRQAASAEQAALALMERGVARPGWAEHVGRRRGGRVLPELRLLRRSRRGRLRLQLRRPGAARAGRGRRLQRRRPGPRRLGHLAGGQAARLLRPVRRPRSRQVQPPQARRLLESALAVTERAADPPVSSSFPSYHAFIRARVRTLPPTLPTGAAPAGRPSRPGSMPAARPPDVAQGPPGDARGRVPGLGRGRGPVRPRGGQPLRRPHRRVRL